MQSTVMNNRAFLLIGAMKAGTTSLFHDLAQNPLIHIPQKEPAYLVGYDIARARAAYDKLFRGVRPGQLVGDASTGYSMLPLYVGVAERALACLGSDTRIIYLVRNPIERTLSHHYHAFSYGVANADSVIALREDPSFVAVSQYSMQLDAWRKVFPPTQVLVVVAEEYFRSRQETIREVCRFLGVPETPLREYTWSNRGEERRLGRWNVVRRSRWYRRHVAPHTPTPIRAYASQLLLSPSPPRPRCPSHDCLQELSDKLGYDVEALTSFLGRSEPPWDLSDTVRQLAEGATA